MKVYELITFLADRPACEDVVITDVHGEDFDILEAEIADGRVVLYEKDKEAE